MGMFDSVYVKCDKCGEDVEFQSKAGDCLLEKYSIDDTPAEVAADLNGESKSCRVCGHITTLHFVFFARGWTM